MRLRIGVLMAVMGLLGVVGLATAASAGATTIDFEAMPPANDTAISTQYNNVDPPYGGVEFVSGSDSGGTPFQTPVVRSIGAIAHSGTRVLQFTGEQTQAASGLWASFDTARQSVSLYLEQATQATAGTTFTAVGYDQTGDEVVKTTAQLTGSPKGGGWVLLSLTAPGTLSSGWITTLKLTGGAASDADVYQVDDLSFSDPVTAPPPPSADFSCSPGCAADAGATITFSATTNAIQQSYSWDLNGDGTFGDSTAATPQYTFTQPGSYPVALRVTDGTDGESTTVQHTVTIDPPATVQTGKASGISTTGATLNGFVDPHGAPVTDCHFDWGPTTAYGSSAPCASSPGDGDGLMAVSAGLGSLTPGTVYHYRLVASHGFGDVLGADQAFTTAGNSPGFTAQLGVLNRGAIHAGAPVHLQATATPPPGYTIYEYRWAFNGHEHWDTETGGYSVASHAYARAGTHVAEVEVMAHDSSGHTQTTTTLVSISAVTAAAGCSSELHLGFMDFLAACVRNDNGKYTITIGDGVSFGGLLLTSASRDADITVDTTGSDSNHDNPTHEWALRTTGVVNVSIGNAPNGTIELFQIDYSHSPLLIPVGANAPSQNAPGLRLFTFQAGQGCTSSGGVPPVVCAQLPGNVPMEGSISIYVTGGVHGENPGVAVQAILHLLNPIDVSGNVTLTGDTVDGVHLDSWGISTPSFTIGSIFTVDPVTFSYQRTDTSMGHEGDMDVYAGSAGVHFRIPAASGGVSIGWRIANGRFQEANFNLTGTFHLGPVTLTQLGGELGVNPFLVGLNVAGSIGPLGLSAGFLYEDSYHGHPGFIQLGSLDPDHDPNHVAALFATYPAGNPVLKIGAQLFIYLDGFISGQIDALVQLPNVDSTHPTVSVRGEVGGWFSPAGVGGPHATYQIGGGVDARINLGPVNAEATLQGYVNDYFVGGQEHSTAAGCGVVTLNIFGWRPSAGAWLGVDLIDGDHVYDGLSSTPCTNISAWCAPASATGSHSVPPCLGFASASIASAQTGGGPQQLWVPAGTPVSNLLLTSASAYPQVQIRGPSGTYTTPATPGMAGQRPTFVSGAIPAQHQLIVSLMHPLPGAYTITPVPGSPAIEPVLEKHDLPRAVLRVSVSGRGAHRTLHYALRPQRGQLVQFLERAADVDSPIGRPTGAARGMIAFAPLAGAVSRRRRIVAEVFEHGDVQPPHIVGSYTAPAPPRLRAPGRVRATRVRNRVTVTWGPVSGARSYQVWVIGSDGRRALYVEPVRKRRLRIAPVFPEVSLRITVSAVGGVRDQAGPARMLLLRRLR